MGYNPYREHVATKFDYFLVAIGCLVALGLVVWGLLG